MNVRKIIPARDADFHIEQLRLRAAADANVTQWGLDATWMAEEFDPAADNWDARYAAYLEPLTRTPLITAEKTAARKAYEPLISMPVKGLRVNPRPDEDRRLALGLTDYDSTRTPPAIPLTWPEAVVTPVGPGLLRLDWHDSDSSRRAKPPGVHGTEIRSGILAQPPLSPEDIPHSEFSTRTPRIIEFDLKLRGQTVYFCLRRENSRGQKGPWSEILYAIIP